MYKNITIRAGARALEILRDGGFSPGRIRVLAGASGGPKWLVLAGMDRVLPGLFKGRRDPLFLLGSSIGAWRMAALAQRDPARALENFEEAYITQRYSPKPDIHEVTRESYRVLGSYVADDAIRYLLAHPFMRTSLLAVRSLHFGAGDRALTQGAHLGAAALANLASRRMLRFFFRRVLFHDARNLPPFYGMGPFPLDAVELSADNFRKALMASGSIPLVMEGIRGISGAPAGTYRDGGIIDYHLDVPFNVGADELVLYPHFYDYLIPGWFDKPLKRRNPDPANMANVVLVSPSRDFVDSLPLRKIPDRDDFYRFRGRDGERIGCWREAALRSRCVGEEFLEALESRRLGGIARPLERRQGGA